MLVGCVARARAARQRRDGSGEQSEGLGPASARPEDGEEGERKGAGFHQGAIDALCRERPGRSASARRSLCCCDGGACREVSGRSRRRDAVRRIDDGPPTLGLLRRERPAQGAYGGGSETARIGNAAKSGARSCAAPLCPRGRGLARPCEGCRRGGHAARAAARLWSPRPHASAHLRASWPLPRRRHREPEGDRSG